MGQAGSRFRRVGATFLLGAGLLLAAPSGPARGADALVADLSDHLISITTGFSGTDLLLFGAAEGEGDVVVAVRGPARPEIVRHKERRLGIWINSGHVRIAHVPSFYRIVASRPLGDIAAAPVLARYRLGLDHLGLAVEGGDESAASYLDALGRLMRRGGLWAREAPGVEFLGRHLFRADVHFPANVPVGIYSVEVYLFRNGEVVEAQTTPLSVQQTGLDADIADFAHRFAALYGTMAAILAIAAGWLVAVAFRRM